MHMIKRKFYEKTIFKELDSRDVKKIKITIEKYSCINKVFKHTILKYFFIYLLPSIP